MSAYPQLQYNDIFKANALAWLCSIAFCATLMGQCQCQEPCIEYREIGDPRRSVMYSKPSSDPYLCDVYKVREEGAWYHFDQYTGGEMPTFCPDRDRCGTHFPIWMNGTHPTEIGQETEAIACTHYMECCTYAELMKVKLCERDGKTYYVYQLPPVPDCSKSYCAGDKMPCRPSEIWDSVRQRCIDVTETTSKDFTSNSKSTRSTSGSSTLKPTTTNEPSPRPDSTSQTNITTHQDPVTSPKTTTASQTTRTSITPTEYQLSSTKYVPPTTAKSLVPDTTTYGTKNSTETFPIWALLVFGFVFMCLGAGIAFAVLYYRRKRLEKKKATTSSAAENKIPDTELADIDRPPAYESIAKVVEEHNYSTIKSIKSDHTYDTINNFNQCKA